MLLLVPPSPALYIALVGTAAAGGVAVFVDPWMPRARIDEAITAVSPRVFVGVPRAHLLRFGSSAMRAIPRRIVVREPGVLSALTPGERFDDVLAGAKAPLPLTDVSGESPSIITFTSGTTGSPKGAVRTHRLLAAQADALDRALPRRSGDVDLATLPVFALLAVSQGVPSVFAAIHGGDVSRFQPSDVVAQLLRHRVTGVGGSPSFLLKLARHVLRERVALPDVRLVTVGGAPAGKHLLRVLVDAFPAASVKVLYGSTEAEPVASAEAREILTLGGRGCCVGRPHAGVEVRVVRQDVPIAAHVHTMDDVAVKSGEVGEVVIAGPVVLERYMDARDTDNTKIVDGSGRRWHRMGDLGRLDEEGRIWLHGRCGEAVRTAAGTVFPLDVEPLAEALEPVARAGLVGRDGRAILAVVPAPGHAPADAAEAARLVLREAKMDVEVVAVREIAVDSRHRSRVNRSALRARVAQQ